MAEPDEAELVERVAAAIWRASDFSFSATVSEADKLTLAWASRLREARAAIDEIRRIRALKDKP